MHNTERFFFRDTALKAKDQQHKDIIRFNMGKYHSAVEKGTSALDNLDHLKTLAHEIKTHTISHWHHYLTTWEKKAKENGIKVLWASNAEEARLHVEKILSEKKAKSIVKSKSMVTEEIELNHFLRARDYEVLETDLGEFIVDLLHQKPYHIVTPAMHLSRQDITRLFHQKLNMSLDSSVEDLTLGVRKLLRSKFFKADVGITGGNFLIADTGSMALTENEGNARISTSIPKTQISIVGIEKIVPSLQHMHLFWHLLSTHGTGQKLSVYQTLISKPTKFPDGSKKDLYVILLDNNRTQLFANQELRKALCCIRCGACLNACPVYQTIGGHSYASTYSGPIGAVIAPHIESNNYSHLSYASTLCGKCSEVCPVKIPIDSLIWLNRTLFAEKDSKKALGSQKWFWKLWAFAMQYRSLINSINGNTKTRWIQLLFKGKISKSFPKNSFNQEVKD